AAFDLGEFEYRLAFAVNQLDEIEAADRPADDVLQFRHLNGASLVHLELEQGAAGIGLEDELAGAITIGIGNLPLADHGLERLVRRYRIRGGGWRRRESGNDKESPERGPEHALATGHFDTSPCKGAATIMGAGLPRSNHAGVEVLNCVIFSAASPE